MNNNIYLVLWNNQGLVNICDVSQELDILIKWEKARTFKILKGEEIRNRPVPSLHRMLLSTTLGPPILEHKLYEFQSSLDMETIKNKFKLKQV